MSEIDRISSTTPDDFGVKAVAPLRETDMMRIIRRLEPLLYSGVSFYSHESRPNKKMVVHSSSVIRPFGIIVHSGCLNICGCSNYNEMLYSVELEMDGDTISTMTIAIVAALLHKKGFTHFEILRD